jgi:hypothetical protein
MEVKMRLVVCLLLSVSTASGMVRVPTSNMSRIKAMVEEYKSHKPVMHVSQPTASPKAQKAQVNRTGSPRRQVIHVEYSPCRTVTVSSVGESPLLDIVEREAAQVGVSPVVMWAIEWHETGGYSSPKWRKLNNPGGIEYRHFDGIPCEKHGRWAGFSSPEDGIKAHALVLSNRRYDGARRTSDPLQQVEAIGRGGYCEPGYNWTAQVKNHVRKFLNVFRSRRHQARPSSAD